MAGLYLHIPFCRKACTYCDFHFSTNMQLRGAVQDAMLRELGVRAKEVDNDPIGTIYFGGGTPSLLSGDELTALLAQIQQLFVVEVDAEVTLEVNPDDVNEERIALWKSGGINRLSIGIQSFREERLRFMGRAHTAEQSIRSLEMISQAGFKSWTMDLIYGLPGMTLKEWDEQLSTALAFGLPHLSAYCLTVESKTTLDHRVRAGDVKMPDDEEQAIQFQHLIDRMREAGLTQYEISNFGREGHFSRHNTSYWKGTSYWGIGPGAHSFNGERRRWNVANNARYVKGVNEGGVYWNEEFLTPAQRVNEHLMTGLRTIWGVDLGTLGADLFQENGALVRHYLERGDLVLMDGRLALTEQGKAFADRIASDLFITDDR